MSFLKSLKKAANSAVEVVSNAAELANLDHIVDDCLEHYDDQVNKFILTCTQYVSAEECTRLENEWMTHWNQRYDQRAHECTGRKVPDNWRDGGKDLVEVRKRILNRRLDERRGKLFERTAVMFQDGAVRVDHTRTSVQRKIEEFQANAESVLPISEADLKALIAEVSASLDLWVTEYYPEGIEKFKEDSMKCKSMSVYNDFVEVVIPQVKVELSKKNRQLTEVLQKVFSDALDKAAAFHGETETKLPLSPEELQNLINADLAEIIRQVDVLYPQGKDVFDRAAQATAGKSYLADIEQRHAAVCQEVQLSNQSAISLLEACFQKGQAFCAGLLAAHQASLPLSAAALSDEIQAARQQLLTLINDNYHNSMERFVADSKRVKGESWLDALLSSDFQAFSNTISQENEAATMKVADTGSAAQHQLEQNFQSVGASLPLQAAVLEQKVDEFRQKMISTIVDSYGALDKFERDSVAINAAITVATLTADWTAEKDKVVTSNAALVERLRQESQARITNSILQQMQEQCRVVLQQVLEQERAAQSLSFLSAEQAEELLSAVQQQAVGFIPK